MGNRRRYSYIQLRNVVVLILLIWVAVWLVVGTGVWKLVRQYYARPIPITRTVFVAKAAKPLIFNMPSFAQKLRISVAPVLSDDLRSLPKFLSYRVKVQAYATNDKMIMSRYYNFHRDISRTIMRNALARYGAISIGTHPLSTQSFVLLLNSKQRVARVVIKPDSAAPIRALVVGVKISYPVPFWQRQIAWGQLSTEGRAILAKGNIYGADALTDVEKGYLLADKWYSLAPQGIDGKDFIKKEFLDYHILSPKSVDATKPLQYISVLVTHDRYLTATLPKAKNRILVKAVVAEAGLPKGGIVLNLHWYGRTIEQERSVKLLVKKLPYSKSLSFARGMVVVNSSSPVLVNISAVRADKKVVANLTRAIYRRMLLVTKHPICYDIIHYRNHPSLFLLKAKSMFADRGLQTTKPWLHYKLYNKTHTPVFFGAVQLNDIYSNYDFIVNEPEMSVSDDAESYFLLPHKVQKICFVGERALINAYTRPLGLLRTYRIPEDFYKRPADIEKEPSWFALKPEHTQFDTKLLWVQRQPPEREQYIVTGNYISAPIKPEGLWRGDYTLLPNKHLVKKIQPSSLYYQVIPNHKLVKLHFASGRESVDIKPRLLVFAAQSGYASIMVDGVKVAEQHITPHLATISMPPVKPGWHNVKVDVNVAAKIYLNYLYPTDKMYVKKILYRIGEQQPLVFSYNKPAHKKRN